MVSVSITTYNSENFLPRALDSVLMQQRDFPLEIVISDDTSTDETLRIAKSYRDRHPGIIRLFERPCNVGVQRNTYESLERCRGKYTAFLDADDFWTDPAKLATQYAILEADPTLNVCAHHVRWVTEDGHVQRETYPALPAGRYGFDEIIRHNFIPTLSALFRSGVHRQLPPWYFDLGSTSDWPLWILSAGTGDILLLDRLMADYTLNLQSAFTAKGKMYWFKADAKFYEYMPEILPHEWHRLAHREKGRRYQAMAYALRQTGDFPASRNAALKAFLAPDLRDNVKGKTITLLAALLHLTPAKSELPTIDT